MKSKELGGPSYATMIRCAWDVGGGSMREPKMPEVEPIAHDLRRAAHLIMREAGAQYDETGYEKAKELLRKLTTPREQL